MVDEEEDADADADEDEFEVEDMLGRERACRVGMHANGFVPKWDGGRPNFELMDQFENRKGDRQNSGWKRRRGWVGCKDWTTAGLIAFWQVSCNYARSKPTWCVKRGEATKSGRRRDVTKNNHGAWDA